MKSHFLSIASLACVLAISSTSFAQSVPTDQLRPIDTSQAQAVDSSGQQWQHPDRTYLLSWVASRNASLVGSVANYVATGRAVQVMAPAAQYATQPVYAQPVSGDAYGFTNWLNGVRAQYGRGPVSYDPGLSAEAATNNAQQQMRGLGHWGMGSARRQNSGMGSASSVWNAWMASPPHQSALLDPSLTIIGIANNGQWWTFDGR